MSLLLASDVTPIRWHGVDGYALDLPASCTGFLVRCLQPDGRGYELVIHDHTGGPLVLPVVLTQRELCAWLDWRVGRYVLSPVDAGCRRVDAPEAAIWLTESMAARGAIWRAIEEVSSSASIEGTWAPPPAVRAKGGSS